MNNGDKKKPENIPAAGLSGDRRELFERLLKKKLSEQAAAKKILRLDSLIAPLSSAQQRMWFAYQWESASNAYNRPAAIRLQGPLVADAFTQSLNRLVERHEVFRTVFSSMDGKPIQSILPAMPLSIPVVDLSELGASEKEKQLNLLLKQAAAQPFDLQQGPVVRPLLVRLSPEEHLFLLMMHHIIFDGWSMDILLRDLRTLYAKAVSGTGFTLPELPIRYVDFAHWQQQWLRNPVVTKQLAYWKSQLRGPLPVLELPIDRPRPAIQQFEGAQYRFVIPPTLAKQIRHFTQEHGVTLFMTLLAAFRTLLYRYSNQEDIIIGAPVAGRNQLETEHLIGVFINTLALRLPLDANQTFEQVVKTTQQVALQAYDNQDVPFEQLVEQINPDRNLSHSPIFQVLFQLRNRSDRGSRHGDLLFEEVEINSGVASLDLALEITEQGDSLSGLFVYSTALFNPATMERMAGHLLTLLKAALTNPDQPVATLPLLTEAEQQQLLVEWNGNDEIQAKDQCVHHLFEQQAEKTPDAIAVMQEGNSLTYRELNARANQLAHHLQSLGVGPEVMVGIGVERSIEQIFGLLAILKAGGAYLPLDVNYPSERIAFMMEDARVAVLLTQEKFLPNLNIRSEKVVCLDADWPLIARQADTNPTNGVEPENLMYVIYTSGSTGKPKGVMTPHSAVASFLKATVKVLGLGKTDRVLQFSTINFDMATEDIFCVLVEGGTLVLRNEEMLVVDVLLQKCLEWEVTVLYLPTAYWHFLVTELLRSDIPFPALVRLVIVGGERIQAGPVKDWLHRFGHYPTLFNSYGPTETTVLATMYDCSNFARETEREVPIGFPLENTSAYVLDQHQQLVPIGVPGELYIGGGGLARGYLHRTQLTAEKFIAHPFGKPGKRLYKSGDLVRWRSEGSLEYVGRIDGQVKVRGFRIELGEVETVLAQHPDVKEVVIMAHEAAPGEKRLVAYVVAQPEAGIHLSELRGYLREHLPEYMIPSFFVPLEKLPLNLNGKVDRKALPIPAGAAPTEELSVFPQTATERQLADIWSQVLKVKDVTLYDNFFALGGHSLLVMQVTSRMRRKWGIPLSIRQFFESPTVAALSTLVDAVQKNASFATPTKMPLLPRPEWPALSFSQQSLWLLDRLESEANAYRMELGMECRGVLDVTVLEQCFTEITRRHETLRTAFPEEDDTPYQSVGPAEPIRIPVTPIELSQVAWQQMKTCSTEQRQEQLWQLIRPEVQQPFDLSAGPLFRLHLFQLSADWHVLAITMHHSISDGWSLNVLKEELASLYETYSQNKPTTLQELAIQYADFSQWQRQHLQGERLENLLNYWKNQLAGLPPLLELPTDRPRPNRQTFMGADVAFELDAKLAAELRKLCQTTDTTLFMTLMAAFNGLLGHYCRTEDVVVGTPVANRSQSELEPMIGFFVNTLVLRTDLTGDPTFRELLGRVRRRALEAYEHQDLPFEKLVAELHPRRSLSHNPLFQVMFDVQADPYRTMQLPQLTIQPFHPERQEAKFDLSLSFVETGDAIKGRLNYNIDLFNRETMERMAGDLLTLLSVIVADPLQRISHFVSLEKLPLTANGKIDRQALPGLTSQANPEMPETALQTPTEQNLADIWRQVLNLQNVSRHDNFFELGGHSLLAVKLISEIKRRTGQSLPLSAVFAYPSIAELAAQLETPPDPAAWDSLILLQRKGVKKPLYLIHDGWGGIEYGYQLAPFLDTERPVYGFQAIGLNGIDPPLTTIEEMAEHHLRRLLEYQPEGPYHLASFSGGGFIAFEMARRLHLMGKQVGLLALFDVYPIHHGRLTYRQFPLSYVARSIVNFLFSTDIPLRNKWNAVAGKIPRVIKENLKRRMKQKEEERIVTATIDPAMQVKHACLRAYHTHRIQPYPGRLLFIRAIQNPAQFLLNFDFGWRSYAQQGVDVYDIPGNHRMLFREKASLQAIARILGEQLAKVDGLEG